VEPKWRKSKIEREKHEPTRNMPKIETEDPILAKFLTESEEPMCAKSNIESADPTRAKDLIDIEEPIML